MGPQDNVEEVKEEVDEVKDIEVHNCKELRGFMNYEVMSSREVVTMQMKDFKYRGIILPKKMNSICRRELIKIATVMPVEDDRDLPPEEMITVQSREVILEAIHRLQETKYREIENVDNKGLIIQCSNAEECGRHCM